MKNVDGLWKRYGFIGTSALKKVSNLIRNADTSYSVTSQKTAVLIRCDGQPMQINDAVMMWQTTDTAFIDVPPATTNVTKSKNHTYS